MTTPAVHVVSKTDNAKHAVCHISECLPALSASSVRVRTQMISLTSNNLSYARGGAALHWWETYPVPDTCPVPFNNQDEWGIVPAWGYGRILESRVDTIETGSLLWGFWPTSSHTFDLQLAATELAGHWAETSPHRSKLMTIYNLYVQVGSLSPAEMYIRALYKPLSSGPSQLNTSTFSDLRIHPLGFGGPWSADDADLSSAVVISLSASSKTGRSLFWELARNRDTSKYGPLGLLQLTSAPDTLPCFNTLLPVKSALYEDEDAISWISQFQASRIVIVDFGASNTFLQSLKASISKINTSIVITVIAVGYENKVYTPEELQARMAMGVSKVQLNASGLRDQTIKAIGAEQFFRQSEETWKRCVADDTFAHITIKTLETVEGMQGIEGAWSDLCNRRIPPSIGLIVDLSE